MNCVKANLTEPPYSSADLIQDTLNRIDELAIELNRYSQEKLSSVLKKNDEPPQCDSEPNRKQLPELFNRYQSYLISIEHQLISTLKTLQRVDI